MQTTIQLRPKHDRRVKSGHPWVFANEIDGDVATLPPGGTVEVRDAKGAFIGRGYANPASLIAVRLLTCRPKEEIDNPVFFAGRLREALAYRQRLYPGRRSLRVVYGEGDGLPGLVVDRFEDVLAVQITTLGMEHRKEAIVQALQQVLEPRGAVLRAEGRPRELEGLPDVREVLFGEVPDQVHFEEHGVSFHVAPLGGQKTGHFFDQAENRLRAGRLAKGMQVLDVYANTGGFALQALRHGAVSATAIDADQGNAALAQQNAEAIGAADGLDFQVADARAALEDLVATGRHFGMVCLDPPAFAKSRKMATRALKGYAQINGLGLLLTEPGGFLVTSSCSYHVHEHRLVEVIQDVAREVGRKLRWVHRGEQSPDHPVRPEVPETRYLKHLVFHVELA